MPNLVAEWLFLAAFWAPPAAVVVGGLLALIPKRSVRSRAVISRSTAPVH